MQQLTKQIRGNRMLRVARHHALVRFARCDQFARLMDPDRAIELPIQLGWRVRQLKSGAQNIV